MSDHLHIDIHIEIYDQWQMAHDERGEILKQAISDAIDEKIRAFGFKQNAYFVSGGVY